MRYFTPIYICCVLLTGCDISDNDIEPSESFFRIYDNNQFDASFLPLDVIQTSDEGYLIISGTRLETTDFVGVNIIRVDKAGNFLKERVLASNFVHPVADWMAIDNTYYFFCMDDATLQTQLFSVDAAGNLSNPIPVGVTMPQHASLDGQEFVLSSYDNINRATILSIVSTDGRITASASFPIGDGEGVEEPVIDHYTRTGRQFPFTTGRLDNGSYYFNGFFNFTLSLVFTDLSGVTGVVQGQQENGGFSAVMPLMGSQFAAARFNFGDNYVLPNVELNTSGLSSSADLGGNPILEFVPDARVYIERITIDGQAILVYASTTKNGQVIIILYDETDGAWLGTNYLGFSNPFNVRSLHQTIDGGLAILAQTSVVGRFPRSSLFKLSAKELKGMIVVN